MCAAIELRRRYRLRLGPSLLPPSQPSTDLASTSSSSLVTCHYNFQPESIDKQTPGSLSISESGAARAIFSAIENTQNTNNEVEKKRLLYFKGALTCDPAEHVLLLSKDECSGESVFRLEKVSAAVTSLLHERGADFEKKTAVNAKTAVGKGSKRGGRSIADLKPNKKKAKFVVVASGKETETSPPELNTSISTNNNSSKDIDEAR